MFTRVYPSPVDGTACEVFAGIAGVADTNGKQHLRLDVVLYTDVYLPESFKTMFKEMVTIKIQEMMEEIHTGYAPKSQA